MKDIKKHKVVNKQHCIEDNKGKIHVFTEQEWEHITWWNKLKKKLF